jgi:bifunctional DNA-binding transcriptional regulator/antitoxin component of YhaV-PrlF toxin-antitoxin module
MISKTLSIGPRGEITLPKKIRDLFKNNSALVELLENNHAMISPAPNVKGALSEFKLKTDLNFEKIRNKAWFLNIGKI